MPRPMPDSKYDADRERLNVTMHWYAFHVFTMRSTCSFGVDTCNPSSSSDHRERRSPNAPSTTSASRYRRMTGRTSAWFNRPSWNFSRFGFSK